MHWYLFFIIKSLSVFLLKSTLADISIAVEIVFGLVLLWSSSSHPITFNLSCLYLMEVIFLTIKKKKKMWNTVLPCKCSILSTHCLILGTFKTLEGRQSPSLKQDPLGPSVLPTLHQTMGDFLSEYLKHSTQLHTCVQHQIPAKLNRIFESLQIFNLAHQPFTSTKILFGFFLLSISPEQLNSACTLNWHMPPKEKTKKWLKIFTHQRNILLPRI